MKAKKARLSVYMMPELKDDLDLKAEKLGISTNAYIISAVKEKLKKDAKK